MLEKLKMHKIHTKVFLGLAAIIIVAGIAYMATQSKGQVASDCESKTYTLSKDSGVLTYKSDSGDTLTYDTGSKLITNNPMGSFSYDGGTTWSSFLDLGAVAKTNTFLYAPDLKNQPTNIQTFTDVIFTGSSVTFTTLFCPPCLTRITLDKANLTYETPIGNITFGGNVLSSTNPDMAFSSDGVNFSALLDLNALKTTTISLRDKKTNVTFSLTNVVYDPKGPSLSFDVPCVSCTTKITLNKANLTYETPIGNITFGGDTLDSINPAMEFSIDNSRWLEKLDLNVFIGATIFLRDKNTGETFSLTNVVYVRDVSLSFDVPCPEFTANLRVSVEEVVSGSQRTDTALKTKIFNVTDGAVAGILTQPQNYEAIFKTPAENTQNETNSPVVGNSPRNLKTDLVGIGANPGSKLVIVESQANKDGSHGYMGFDIPNLVEDQSIDVGFNIVPGQDTTFVQTSYFTQNSNGVWQSARRAQVLKGSELSVFQPDDVIWTNGTEIYPFLFISDSDWTVDVCLEVPAGYQVVAPGTCGQTLIANETKVLEFKVTDVGSPKEFKVKTKMSFTHKGKKQNLNFDVKSHNPKARGN